MKDVELKHLSIALKLEAITPAHAFSSLQFQMFSSCHVKKKIYELFKSI